MQITDHAPAIPDGAHPWHFQNLKAIPREIYGVKILYGAEVNILDLEGNIDLADEVLEKLDVVMQVYTHLATRTVTRQTIRVRIWR